jgi:hypothetical protein
LPSEDEWETAFKSNLADGNQNLRGNATKTYIDGIKLLGEGASDDLEDLLGYESDRWNHIEALSVPQDSNASNEVMWFRDVPGYAEKFIDLGSNMSQWVTKPSTTPEQSVLDETNYLTEAQSLKQFSARFERIGRSTLSLRTDALNVVRPVNLTTGGQEFHDRYPDVGFRIAFDADAGDIDPRELVLKAGYLPYPPQ